MYVYLRFSLLYQIVISSDNSQNPKIKSLFNLFLFCISLLEYQIYNFIDHKKIIENESYVFTEDEKRLLNNFKEYILKNFDSYDWLSKDVTTKMNDLAMMNGKIKMLNFDNEKKQVLAIYLLFCIIRKHIYCPAVGDINHIGHETICGSDYNPLSVYKDIMQTDNFNCLDDDRAIFDEAKNYRKTIFLIDNKMQRDQPVNMWEYFLETIKRNFTYDSRDTAKKEFFSILDQLEKSKYAANNLPDKIKKMIIISKIKKTILFAEKICHKCNMSMSAVGDLM